MFSWLHAAMMVKLAPDQRPPEEPLRTPFVELMRFLGKPGIMDILYHAGPGADGSIRFNELQAASGIPRNTLVNRLKELVEHGFLERHEYDENPPRVQYEVTQRVVDLIPGFRGFHAWCRDHALHLDHAEPRPESERQG